MLILKYCNSIPRYVKDISVLYNFLNFAKFYNNPYILNNPKWGQNSFKDLNLIKRQGERQILILNFIYWEK